MDDELWGLGDRSRVHMSGQTVLPREDAYLMSKEVPRQEEEECEGLRFPWGTMCGQPGSRAQWEALGVLFMGTSVTL